MSTAWSVTLVMAGTVVACVAMLGWCIVISRLIDGDHPVLAFLMFTGTMTVSAGAVTALNLTGILT